MAHVRVDRIVNTVPLDVGASWHDLGSIATLNPKLSGSHLLNKQTKGLGGSHQCDLNDGKSHIRERQIECQPSERTFVNIFDWGIRRDDGSVDRAFAESTPQAFLDGNVDRAEALAA